jgi:poly-gamma-glutamate capsule biosynthesis protein CapA/YwtB (metallophosphatase superfamily)
MMNHRKTITVARLVIFLCLIAFAAACSAGEPPPVALVPETEAVQNDPPASPTPTPEPPPTGAPTMTPTTTPTTTPTLTPSPTAQPVTISVPPQWAEAVNDALAALEAEAGSRYAWQVEETQEGESNQSSLSLARGDDGLVVREEPLAFAVPFTTNWEFINTAEAEAILSGSHNLVRVIPWSQMERTSKALRVDGRHPTDPDYPYWETWSLVAAPGYEAVAADLTPPLQTALAPLPTIRLAAVGDLMLGRTQGEIMLSTGNLLYSFERVKHIFDAADYTVGNLESAVGDIGEPAPKRYPLQSPPEAAQSLVLAGVDLVSLANNHAMDYGPAALLHGIDLLHQAGVATVGGGADDVAAHAPHITEIGGLTVAFLGYVHVPVEASTHFDTQTWTATADEPGLAWAEPERIQADVAAVRPEVDLVVVILHSGYEYIEEPSEPQVAAARAAVDAGADLVVGHHAHILQGIHNYRHGVIAYGLGNFVFNIDGPPETAILNIWLDENGVRQLELIPAIVQQFGQPRLADFAEAGPILSRVYYLTTLLNATPVD